MATGTPSGVGYARTPAWLLHAGDSVEVEIEGIGSVRSHVVAHASSARTAAERRQGRVVSDGRSSEPAPRSTASSSAPGPSDLLTALLLGQGGLAGHVVERWPARYPLPRACTIDHEALRILQAAGVMAEHADLFEPSQGERGGYQIRNADGELLRAINWNRAAESGWANTNGFYQPDLEEVLEEMVEDAAGRRDPARMDGHRHRRHG